MRNLPFFRLHSFVALPLKADSRGSELMWSLEPDHLQRWIRRCGWSIHFGLVFFFKIIQKESDDDWSPERLRPYPLRSFACRLVFKMSLKIPPSNLFSLKNKRNPWKKRAKNAAKQMSSTSHINPWSLESRGVAALRPNVKKCCCTRDISWNPY